jgi:hypothetical protein
MLPKPIDQIDLTDLQALLGNAQESKTLEFKRELANDNNGKTKLLAGISALANTAGGDFLIGVAAENGLATALPGIHLPDLDAEKQRIENLLRDCLEPRLPRIDIHPVALGDDKYVLVLRVPFSWIGPHRVTRDNVFYGRHSAGIKPLDVQELRTAFTLGENIAERIRAFRAGRLAKIVAGETPVPMKAKSAVVLHLVPLPPVANRLHLDLVAKIEAGHYFPLPLGNTDGQHGNQHGVNLDGIYNFYGSADAAAGYVQLFRNGTIEGVYGMRDEGGPYIADHPFGNMLIGGARQYRDVINDMNVGFPVFAMLSFVGTEPCRMRYGIMGGSSWTWSVTLRDSVVAFPEVVLDGPTADAAIAFRSTLNQAWNAFGLHKCSMYNGTGDWIGTG